MFATPYSCCRLIFHCFPAPCGQPLSTYAPRSGNAIRNPSGYILVMSPSCDRSAAPIPPTIPSTILELHIPAAQKRDQLINAEIGQDLPIPVERRRLSLARPLQHRRPSFRIHRDVLQAIPDSVAIEEGDHVRAVRATGLGEENGKFSSHNQHGTPEINFVPRPHPRDQIRSVTTPASST